MRKPVLPLMAAAALAMAAPVPAAAQGVSLGSLFSCADPNGRTGAIVGGIAGALAGSQISRNERTLGAVVGAGLGAWAGNQIACRMNNASRDQAQTAVEQALNTGRPQTWRDARTGATGRVEVVSNGFDDRYAAAPSAGDYTSNVSATDLRYARGVQRIHSGLQSAAPIYVSPGRVNLRAAPSAKAPVVDRLRPGQQVHVVGMVNGAWLAVADGGWVKGYVAASAVRASAPTAYVRNMDSPYTCRLVQQTVSLHGYPTEVQRFNACRDSAGQWRFDPV